MINSYPSVFQIGHKAIADIFTGSVIVEEKVDGSQFSFGVIDGVLQCRSKGKQLILDAPEKMFEKAVSSARLLSPFLHPEWIYRGEYLERPKHNTLAYGRTPRMNIIGFDIVTGPECYLSPEEKQAEFIRLGLEFVPLLYVGVVENKAMFDEFLQLESVLGGCKIEGVVVKNYNVFSLEKKVSMGKYVSEIFKENHTRDWKERNPTRSDIIDQLIAEYRTEARWQKAVQHLAEIGAIYQSPKDIGPLMKEVSADILRECEDEIKQKLFDYAWKNISRGVIAGLAEWYKQKLLEDAFEQ